MTNRDKNFHTEIDKIEANLRFYLYDMENTHKQDYSSESVDLCKVIINCIDENKYSLERSDNE